MVRVRAGLGLCHVYCMGIVRVRVALGFSTGLGLALEFRVKVMVEIGFMVRVGLEFRVKVMVEIGFMVRVGLEFRVKVRVGTRQSTHNKNTQSLTHFIDIGYIREDKIGSSHSH